MPEPDVTVKRIEDMESYEGPHAPRGQFVYAGRSLGVTAWGMNVLHLPARWERYPEHDHQKDGQEEVYVVLEGDATLSAGGKEWKLERGSIARVGADQKRRIVPGDRGVTIVAIGGTPGKAYEPKTK